MHANAQQSRPKGFAMSKHPAQGLSANSTFAQRPKPMAPSQLSAFAMTARQANLQPSRQKSIPGREGMSARSAAQV